MTLPAALIEPLLRAWLAEDLGRGDLSAPALAGRSARASWQAKQAGVFCGGVLVEPLFRLLDPGVVVQLRVADGERVEPGQRLERHHRLYRRGAASQQHYLHGSRYLG
jgi:nicotinate-nucleotide pyrophosphorylase (carboxylating)